MVALPKLETYSQEQLEDARRISPAFARYEKIVQTAPPEPLGRRHRAWMTCVLATIFETADASQVCHFWSDEADAILQEVWRECGLDSLPIALFALGKLGAHELNLSSDLDLLLVAEPSFALEAEKKLREFRRRLHEPTDAGFCFRLDFDLRPGGKLGPFLTSPSQFQDYYWSQGETWERLALVRLRALAGPQELVANIEDLTRRFCYRKFLDFTLLEDLKALRSRIHQTGFVRQAEQLHLKLEVGGIRDIELFTHSLLVLNGGKIPDLQTLSTTTALKKIASHKLLPTEECDFLLESYWILRQFENRVQAIDDRQTHVLPSGEAQELLPRMARIDQIVSGLLGRIDLNAEHLPASEEAQLAWLKGLGFEDEIVNTTWPTLIQATALSHKNDRDERARREFLFHFVTALSKPTQLDRALGFNTLVDFVRATRAKATFFSMLLGTPKLMEDLARLFCLSPYLGHILSSRPELLDHYVLQVEDSWSSDSEELLKQLADRKRLGELWAATRFLSDHNLETLFHYTTETADVVAERLLLQLKSEFPTSSVEIMTLGKWAGAEMGLRSDLDFIFVCSQAPSEADFKLARRFISRLTDPLKSGSLYEIDLRLRPEGSSSPLLVTRDSLHEYWRTRAEVWERQAYLRARDLNRGLALDKSLLVRTPLSTDDKNELARIRSRLLKPAQKDLIDLKYAPAAILDIEFAAQLAFLENQVAPTAAGTVPMIEQLGSISSEWKLHGLRLLEIYLRLREIEQLLQLSSAHKTTEIRPTQEAWIKTSTLLGQNPEAAEDHVRKLLIESESLLVKLDCRRK